MILHGRASGLEWTEKWWTGVDTGGQDEEIMNFESRGGKGACNFVVALPELPLLLFFNSAACFGGFFVIILFFVYLLSCMVATARPVIQNNEGGI